MLYIKTLCHILDCILLSFPPLLVRGCVVQGSGATAGSVLGNTFMHPQPGNYQSESIDCYSEHLLHKQPWTLQDDVHPRYISAHREHR